jgi:hypothetical protein
MTEGSPKWRGAYTEHQSGSGLVLRILPNTTALPASRQITARSPAQGRSVSIAEGCAFAIGLAQRV